MIVAFHELVLSILLAVAVSLLMLCGFVIARLYERAEQREERHRLRSELAACKMVLQHNGIKFPPEDEG